MYQIWKLTNGAAPTVFATCTTQMELLDIWSQKCSPVRAKLDFSTLNVTGKDTALQMGGGRKTVLGKSLKTLCFQGTA